MVLKPMKTAVGFLSGWATMSFFCLSAVHATEVYRCESGGNVAFSDTPCSPEAEKISVQADKLGSTLDRGIPADDPETIATSDPERQETEEKSEEEGCPAGYIQSTELRRLKVAEEVRIGMSEEQVRYVLGSPTRISNGWWYYSLGKIPSLRFRFVEGCLVRREADPIPVILYPEFPRINYR